MHRLPHCPLIRLANVLLLFLFVTALGCGPGTPVGRRPISGQVPLDGVPLDRGRIRFRPQDAHQAVGSGAVIEQGRYQMATAQGLPPGKYLVRINAPQEDHTPLPADVPPGTPVARVGIERVPAEYNRDSNLVVEVTADGRNRFDFEIRTDQ